jgi:hypothetical protein
MQQDQAKEATQGNKRYGQTLARPGYDKHEQDRERDESQEYITEHPAPVTVFFVGYALEPEHGALYEFEQGNLPEYLLFVV